MRQQIVDLERAHNTRVQSLEKARDRAEDEARSLRNLVDAIQSQVNDLSHGQQWLEEKQKKQELDLNQSSRSSPNNSQTQLPHPTDLSQNNGLGSRQLRAKGGQSPRTVVSADVVLDDGTRHLPFQAEADRERDKQETEILGPDRSYTSPLFKDDRRRPAGSNGSLNNRDLSLNNRDLSLNNRDLSVERDPLHNPHSARAQRPRQDPGRAESPSRSYPLAITSPQPTETATTIKTPTAKQGGRTHKVVIIQRQPIPGSQVGPDDKVGIGISFGMTAKGDVFITGMAPNGPAKSSGHIRRGDQLVAVDGTEISTWDVKDIVDLIVGAQGSFVRLEIATLPEDQFSPSPPPK